MIRSTLVILSLLTTLFTGCALTPSNAPAYTPAPKAPDGYATIYVLRNNTGTNVSTVKILVAGSPIADLALRTYTWVYVKAGSHNIAAEWPLLLTGQPSTSLNHTFAAGKTYHFRIRTGLERSGGFFSSGFIVSSYLELLPPEHGEAELIACCRYLPAPKTTL